MRKFSVGIWVAGILIGVAGLALVGVLPGSSHENWLMIGDGITNGRLGFWTTIVGGLVAVCGAIATAVALGRRRASARNRVVIALGEAALWLSVVAAIVVAVPSLFLVSLFGRIDEHYSSLRAPDGRDLVVAQRVIWRPEDVSIEVYERDGVRLAPLWNGDFHGAVSGSEPDAGVVPDSELSVVERDGTTVLRYAGQEAELP